MKKLLTYITLLIFAAGCDDITKNELTNSKSPRIEHTTTSKFDNEEYISFVKNLIEDSLKYNWLYIHPVHIKLNMGSVLDTNTEIQLLPPAPPSILHYRLDSLSFNNASFDSIKIFRNDSIYPKGKGDSLFDYYGRGIIISLPYSHYSMTDILIDYEIVDWGLCGTGKYQTIIYKSK